MAIGLTRRALVLAALAISAGDVAPAAAAPAPEAGADRLSRRLATLSRIRRARIGVHVADESGRVLFARRGHLSFNPASNVKVITAAAALAYLGPEHRFYTEVRGAQRGEAVEGRLYLVGGGDPSLDTAALGGLVRALRRRGVRRVEGPLVVVDTAFDGPTDPPGFKSFRSSGPYRAGVSALSLNANVVRITVNPGPRPGTRAQVTVDPPSAYLVLRPRVYTSWGRTRLHIATHRRGSLRSGVIATGRVRAGSKPYRFWKRVHHPSLYAGHTFVTLLARAGIEVRVAKVRRGKLPRGGAPLLALRSSDTLAEVVRRTIKVSSNTKTEMLMLAAGAAIYGAPATFRKGRRALMRFMKQLGIRRERYRLQNGSGLSRRSRMRPRDMVSVLRAIYRDFTFGPELLAALPIAGIDGTLAPYFRRSPAAGRVRAKTGTLLRTICLSGYVSHGSRRLFFSLMARVRRGSRIRWAQREMLEAMLRYLRGAPDGPP